MVVFSGRTGRNPMYVGVVSMLLGAVVVTGSRSLAIYTVVFFLLANIFIMAYEEPYLADRFGESYRTYKRQVRRWIPRVTPY